MLALFAFLAAAQAQTVIHDDADLKVEVGSLGDFGDPLGVLDVKSGKGVFDPGGLEVIFDERPGKGVVGVIQPPGQLDFKQGNDNVVRIHLKDPSATDGVSVTIEDGWLTVELAGRDAPVVESYLGTGWSFPPT